NLLCTSKLQSESVNGAKDEAKVGQHNPCGPSGSTVPSGSKLDEAKAPEDKAKAPEDEPKTPEDEAKAPEDEAKAPEDEAEAPKEKAKAPAPSGEASLLVLEKEAATVSDIQKEETIRQAKKNAVIVFVRGKSERARKLA